MKKINTLIFLLVIILQVKSQVSNRYQEMQTHFNESEIVFEGYFLKKNPSFITKKKQVFTLSDFKVIRMIKGSIPLDSIIKIETEDGEAVDPETGEVVGGYNSHGNGFIPSTKAIYFLYSKNERGNNNLKRMIDISNPDKIAYNDVPGYEPQPYKNLIDLYNDLSTVSGKKLEVEKKSDLKDVKIDSIPKINYIQKRKNFEEIIKLKIKISKKNTGNKSALVNDLTLQITNPIIIGSIYQFDINIKADNNSTFLDNVPVYLTYNTAVFGSSVVAANNVTVTNGTPFNNSNYLLANSFMIDNMGNEFAFAVSATSSPVRTNITTTYKFLARIQLNILDCGNVSTNLSNSITAINSSFYTNTASGSSFNTYASLSYVGGPLTTSISVCPPVIKDFTSPINGGVNQLLVIKGKKFGNVRGNGQVKFRNADNFGFPYMNKLDNFDYTFWSDTLIEVRMPSTIDTLNSGTIFNDVWTPGSGNFKIITNVGDSITSGLNLAGKTFSVYYSIFNTRPSTAFTSITRSQKLKANLYNSVPSFGGYIVRLDTSVSNDIRKVSCINRAIKEWDCITLVNIKRGTDTIFSGYGLSDYICNITMVNQSQMSNPTVIAETRCNATQICVSPTIRLIKDFDIRINKAYLNKFIYDTVGGGIPPFKIDFLENMYHEIGHGIGLMHVNDSSDMMYYRTLGNLTYSISGNQRRTLIPNTSSTNGGYYQVTSSLNNVNNQCGVQDMQLFNSGTSTCNGVGIKELLNNNFNAIIYPNPTQNGNINLTFDAFENSKPTIEIYNLLGNKLFTETLNTSFNNHYIHSININEFLNGVYILNLTSNSNKASFKIIKN